MSSGLIKTPSSLTKKRPVLPDPLDLQLLHPLPGYGLAQPVFGIKELGPHTPPLDDQRRGIAVDLLLTGVPAPG